MAILNKTLKRKLTEYFKNRLGMFDYRRGWMKGDCPSCSKQFKFGVNISQNRTNCFYCGYNKRPLEVLIDVENFSGYSEAYLLLNKLEGLDFKEGPTIIEEKFSKSGERKLPEGFRLLSMGNSQLARSARSYLKGRGFDIDELTKSGWGYCNKGDYFGYIVIPFYEKGLLKYFITRNYMSNGPKFNNPKAEDFGIGKSMLIYNIDCLQLYKTVFIVESVTNARTIGDNAVATDGKKLSRYQINDFIKSPVERFIIILDPDAYKEAIELGLKLCNHKKVKVVNLGSNKDVNDIGRTKTLLQVYKNRYLNYQELLKIKLSL